MWCDASLCLFAVVVVLCDTVKPCDALLVAMSQGVILRTCVIVTVLLSK
jgi:hypothetical protein